MGSCTAHNPHAATHTQLSLTRSSPTRCHHTQIHTPRTSSSTRHHGPTANGPPTTRQSRRLTPRLVTRTEWAVRQAVVDVAPRTSDTPCTRLARVRRLVGQAHDTRGGEARSLLAVAQRSHLVLTPDAIDEEAARAPVRLRAAEE